MSRPNKRLSAAPQELVDRSRPIHFEFEGRKIEAYEGDTVSSALSAAGVEIHSRSFKYHRPRGLLCVAGRCPNCLMTVDGTPNVRACTASVRDGMQVITQNAWPSTERDFVSVLDRLDRFLPVGFYYKALHKPKFLWELARPIVRRVAGLGSIDVDSDGGPTSNHTNRHTDVAVIGGGPAGMLAASAAADSGADVTLIDDQTLPGGHLLTDIREYFDVPDGLGLSTTTGHEIAAELRERVLGHQRISVLSSSSAFGMYQDNLLAIQTGRDSLNLRATHVVMATGAFEVPHQFHNNDLPGVMLASGALRLARLWGISPGKTAIVTTNDDSGYWAALNLSDAGIVVSAILDSRVVPDSDLLTLVRTAGIEVLAGQTINSAQGTKRVKSIATTSANGETRNIECDLICMSGAWQGASGLLLQSSSAGVDHDGIVRSGVPENVTIAGGVGGVHDLGALLSQAGLAGKRAAAKVGFGVPDDLPAIEAELSVFKSPTTSSAESSASPITQTKKTFVCFCEDVSTKDIAVAVEEGFGDVQTLKRYTTSTMGPCQGKMCHKAFVEVAALNLGLSVKDAGATTSRPPAQPVALGTLAGQNHMPRKRSPLHYVHEQLGAEIVELGPWLRPHNYGSPQDEVLAVRERVGIIDVSTLGKLDIRGPDAGKLLDRVYTHRFSNLREGHIRYGLLCSEAGSIMDDGTVTRMADDHYFVTTTTGNVDAIEDWFNWWMAGTGMDVYVTNVTAAWGAINVAGPRARETLAKLTDVDLSPKAFDYMRSATGEVAGVPSIFLRIGFVGETGWEVHFPAEYAEHLWNTVMEAGSEYGISPFGLEAQRILRLEKGHIIVNQDTDAVTDPLDAGMRWAVRFDKPDFIGRAGIAATRDRESKQSLVGFIADDGFVPEDGLSIVTNGQPVGRVTSSRFSPTRGVGFGLAWVPIEMAEDGTRIFIQSGRNEWPATVITEPIYDPEGSRLRA
ncbi:MAG: (2Fe-2S)-binding protein [Chloroflexi bacterium]|nr:(2Fe-2S)-binding protein [Chloroflexota bacterium]